MIVNHERNIDVDLIEAGLKLCPADREILLEKAISCFCEDVLPTEEDPLLHHLTD